ncbi:coenzyme F420-0:L-glutamate ligase, partial [bacterium]|nr:coenzyme F420-0:L-glutamate ligase [bacterium]
MKKSDFLPLKPNPGKELVKNISGIFWARYPVKSPLITPKSDLPQILRDRVKKYLKKGDIVAISEKVVAIWQKRAWPKDKIKPSFWAKFLSRFVTKTKRGIGISSPETFELAIREVGLPRILLASFFSALTKPFGIRGVFYRIAGRQVAMIDGPVPYALPPYNKYVSLGPKNPHKVAERFAKVLGIDLVCIVDANDYGIEVVGGSEAFRADRKALIPLIKELLRDNPMGQSSEQTPFLILRRLSRYEDEKRCLVFLGDPGAGKG